MKQYIWIRCGDNDDYHKFYNMSKVAAYLKEMGASHPLFIQGSTNPAIGLSDNRDYKNHNYISIFWGGNEAYDVDRGITEEELVELNKCLAKLPFTVEA